MAKRGIDFLVALILIAVLLIPLGFLAWIVRLTSPGDALFVDTRVGRGGKEFKMYKFRTMVGDSTLRFREFKDPNDSRVTSLGRVLRRYSLDELPQLFNVLRGNMSLVGPRPQVWEELHAYPEGLSQRLSVKPGMTGLWQVSGRANLCWDERVALDIAYASRYSLVQDAAIMVRTVRYLTRGAY